MATAHRLQISRSHRVLGMVAAVPIVGWILSSFVLHGVALTLPNGLQGVYELEQSRSSAFALEDPTLLSPDEVLRRIRADGLDRLYWLRLENLGGEPAYVAKPGPFDLERVYDARSGARIDPLPVERLTAIANEQLAGTHVAESENGDEFNRYYSMARVPAVALRMEGDQPSDLVFSRASGRILRRTDPVAEWFHRAYLSVHVWQWGDALKFFTAVLYTLVGTALALVALGYTLWWSRRETRRRWTPSVRRERRIHARFAPVAGFLLATQMLVGAYLWFNLGLIEARFRGQGSFEAAWSGGISTDEVLPTPADVRALAADTDVGTRPWPMYEWRAVGDRRFWLAYPELNANGILVDAAAGKVVERLSADLAARAGTAVVSGEPVGDAVESNEYWMDWNARVPTYRFRFNDARPTCMSRR